jgi:hypothetical protein
MANLCVKQRISEEKLPSYPPIILLDQLNSLRTCPRCLGVGLLPPLLRNGEETNDQFQAIYPEFLQHIQTKSIVFESLGGVRHSRGVGRARRTAAIRKGEESPTYWPHENPSGNKLRAVIF